jgi:membrane protease YdiL (CAAX protease family)
MFALAVVLMVAYTWLAGPVGNDNLWADALVTLVASLAATLIMLRRERRPLRDVGLAWSPLVARDSLMGLTIGAAEFAFVLLLMFLLGTVSYQSDGGTFSSYGATVARDFAAFAIAAASEEVMFRGYPFLILLAAFGAVPAITITSVLFALAHSGNPNVGAFAYLNLFLAGVLFGVAMLRTLSLWYATALHMGWNWALASLADLPVSGLEMFDTPLYEPTVSGPSWVTGGAFGPEAGVLGTVSIGFAMALVVWDTERRKAAGNRVLNG